MFLQTTDTLHVDAFAFVLRKWRSFPSDSSWKLCRLTGAQKLGLLHRRLVFVSRVKLKNQTQSCYVIIVIISLLFYGIVDFCTLIQGWCTTYLWHIFLQRICSLQKCTMAKQRKPTKLNKLFQTCCCCSSLVFQSETQTNDFLFMGLINFWSFFFTQGCYHVACSYWDTC